MLCGTESEHDAQLTADLTPVGGLLLLELRGEDGTRRDDYLDVGLFDMYEKASDCWLVDRLVDTSDLSSLVELSDPGAGPDAAELFADGVLEQLGDRRIETPEQLRMLLVYAYGLGRSHA